MALNSLTGLANSRKGEEALLPWLLLSHPVLIFSPGCCCCCWRGVAVQALVRWGGAMLELAHFKQGAEADDYIKEVRTHPEVDN
jgi:hypothetical protein